jgi:hypothetical protein
MLSSHFSVGFVFAIRNIKEESNLEEVIICYSEEEDESAGEAHESPVCQKNN